MLYFTDGRKAKVKSDELMGIMNDLCRTNNTRCNNSTGTPRLLEEVFSDPDCPGWANYAAVDKDGSAYFYENKPTRRSASWVQGPGDFTGMSEEFDSSNWEKSLIRRPRLK